MSSKAVKAVKAVKSVRPARLRASVFLSAIPAITKSRQSYTCHAVDHIANGRVPFDYPTWLVHSPERFFYERALCEFLPAGFNLMGANQCKWLYTTRIVALQLAALLVEDGFYVNAKGELAQRRIRKPAKKGVRK